MSFFSELKRRNVFRVSGVYAIVAWLLLQVAGALESAMGLPGWFDSLILAVLLIGFPLTLIFAWAFELTPEGIKRTSQVDPEESITGKTASRLDIFLIIGLFAFAGALLAPRFLPGQWSGKSEEVSSEAQGPADGVAAAAVEPSIAVLAFHDMSSGGTEEYFADGVAEEILNLLAKTEGLKVAARTSSFAFKGSSDSIEEIGSKLKVAHVLEGSVRRAGDQIRVTAQLIDSESGYHLWSETYDRKLENIFAIQDEIAASIQTALKSRILGEAPEQVAVERHRSHNIEAYNAYLRGKELLSQRTSESVESAIRQFEQAIEIEPEFALPYAWAARAWILRDWQDLGGLEKTVVDVKAVPLLDTAITLAPDDAEVLAIKGLHQLERFRYKEALQSLNRAIELNPNFAEAYVWRAGSYEREGNYRAMLADREAAYRLDPVSIETARSLVWAYGNYQRFDEAEAIIDAMDSLYPRHRPVYGMRAGLLNVQGRYGELARFLEDALEVFEGDEEFTEFHAYALLQSGLLERVVEAENSWAQRLVARVQGDPQRERKVIEAAGNTDWAMHWEYLFGTQEGLGSAVDDYIAELEQKGQPWADTCDTNHALFFREVGRSGAFESIMDQCRQEYEPAIAAGYLCYCQWLGLIQYFVLTGNPDEALSRLEQWLDRGYSAITLESDEVISQLSDSPGYGKLLKKNAENIAMHREVYLSSG